MSRWLRRLGLALAVSLPACGDGVFIVSVNSGVIVGDPRCQGPRGQYELQEPGGLVVLVVITSSTHIVVAGTTGSCSDLFADAPVRVSGHHTGDRIVASSITLD